VEEIKKKQMKTRRTWRRKRKLKDGRLCNYIRIIKIIDGS